MPELTTPEAAWAALRGAATVAVLGATDDPVRPSFYVPDFLARVGYRVLPVNPTRVGTTLWGQPVVASLADLREPVDLVDVFRRPEQLRGHLADILACRPKIVWFQLGIREPAVAAELVAAGIDVVQDRCTLADLRANGVRPGQAWYR